MGETRPEKRRENERHTIEFLELLAEIIDVEQNRKETQ
jgi:hypothetical protein